MEDFPLLLLFFIIYLIAGFPGKRKQKNRSKARQAARRAGRQGEQTDMRALEQNGQTMASFDGAFAGEPEKKSIACEEKPIHLHDVSQAQLRAAAEGEDPCHLGGEPMREADDAWSEMEETQEAFRQDVLRGVIMSEILTRPQQRRALQRREYHG